MPYLGRGSVRISPKRFALRRHFVSLRSKQDAFLMPKSKMFWVDLSSSKNLIILTKNSLFFFLSFHVSNVTLLGVLGVSN